MARAKSIQRAEARRRYRAAQTSSGGGAAEAGDDVTLVTSASGTASRTSSAGTGTSMFRFARPDLRADLRALPGMFRTRLLLWLPFLMLTIGFVLALAQVLVASNGGGLDPNINRFISFYVGLVLPPLALFPAFIGGFLAPRAAYLVGALIGILDGIFVVTLVSIGGAASVTQGAAPAVAPADLLLLFGSAVVFATLAAAFAAWYSRFLRQSGEKRRIAAMERARARKIEDRKRPRTAR